MVSIRDSHSRDSGSIPGRRNFFNFFFLFHRSKFGHLFSAGCDLLIVILLPKESFTVDGFQATWYSILFSGRRGRRSQLPHAPGFPLYYPDQRTGKCN